MGKSLSASVGRPARNAYEDVRLIQFLLNCVPTRRGGPTRELVVDGVCGPQTMQAIFGFQRALRGPTHRRVDPGGPTFRALAAYDPQPATALATGQPVAAPARGRRFRETTAFVREVVLPGGPDARPALNPAACRFALRHAPSPIHRWGIFASEHIPAGLRVIEYTGELVSPQEASRRSLRSLLYLFFLSPTQQIDGAVGGSGAEYINHSCEPNLRAVVLRGRLYLRSLRAIEAGEELLLDYRISGDGPPLPCRCGVARCRGFLNAPL